MNIARMQRLAEGTVPFETAIRKMTQATGRNDHTRALAMGAELLGEKALKAKLLLVGELHDLEGALPPGLGEYRGYLSKSLMATAKRKLTPEQWEKFRGAF